MAQPLGTIVNPAEVLVDVTATLILDCTAVTFGEAKAMISNLGTASIFIAFGKSNAAAPAGLTTGTGVAIPAGGIGIFDDIGGLAIWGIAAALQVAGTGTRRSAAKV